MGQIQMVDGTQVRGAVLHSGCAPVRGVAEQGEHRELVKRDPALDAVAEAPGDQRGIVGEPAGAVARGPAAQIFERLRHVPVIQACPGFDLSFHQGINQPIVERQSRLVDFATS